MSKENIIKLDEYWPYQVVVLADLVAKHTTSILKEHSELNLSQWRVLAAVAEKPGRTAAEVVTVTPMDKGIVSRATSSLVDKGILDKNNDNDDKRRSRLTVTNSGKSIYKRISRELISQTTSIPVTNAINNQILRLIQGMENLEK